MTPTVRAAALLLLGALLTGCLSAYVGAAPDESSVVTAPPTVASTPSSPTPFVGTVTIRDFAFDPADFTVHPGAVVTVRNTGTVTHTLTAQDPTTFDTGPIAPGGTASFIAPSQPGTYPYLCGYHHFMRGLLTVA
ncbi:cupredoxin domain-containing protein [Kitasatospora sp. NPDC089509]|uniref:cupredoxin domain-containing protein n=1 Tax=Kitasatospora sp. NPDC089509 TaxID=3364079 RepID=UPI0038187586